MERKERSRKLDTFDKLCLGFCGMLAVTAVMSVAEVAEKHGQSVPETATTSTLQSQEVKGEAVMGNVVELQPGGALLDRQIEGHNGQTLVFKFPGIGTRPGASR